MSGAAPRLYLITDRHATSGRDLADLLDDALAGTPPGALAVQLRDKDLGGRELAALAHRLRAVTRAHGAALFVNDRIDVALACGADGVHLGGTSLPLATVRALAPSLRIAVSTHDPAEVSAAARAGAAFAVFGPVFATPSKLAFGAPQGLERLTDACRRDLPVLALGGVNLQTAPACVRAGAAGLACVRSIFSAESPRTAVGDLLACLDSPTVPGAAGA